MPEVIDVFVGIDDNNVCIIPQYAHGDEDAGADLYSIETIEIPAGEMRLVHTGIHLAIPKGYVGVVCGRSGLGINHMLHLVQGVGIIDSGYRGEIMIPLHNQKPKEWWVKRIFRKIFNLPDPTVVTIPKGMRIAQILFIPVSNAFLVLVGPVEGLPASLRDKKGFGSSGR